jgi:hypothetical protein
MVEAVECSGFTCWVSHVDADEFGENLTRNMENLEWLADASVRHQRVVGTIHERLPILPARFGIVFLNEKSLAGDVSGRKGALRASFRRIADADEWGIRVFGPARAALADVGAVAAIAASEIRSLAGPLRAQVRGTLSRGMYRTLAAVFVRGG